MTREEEQEHMIAALAQAWKERPQLRLGQLLVNASGRRDPFFVRDVELSEHLRILNS